MDLKDSQLRNLIIRLEVRSRAVLKSQKLEPITIESRTNPNSFPHHPQANSALCRGLEVPGERKMGFSIRRRIELLRPIFLRNLLFRKSYWIRMKQSSVPRYCNCNYWAISGTVFELDCFSFPTFIRSDGAIELDLLFEWEFG